MWSTMEIVNAETTLHNHAASFGDFPRTMENELSVPAVERSCFLPLWIFWQSSTAVRVSGRHGNMDDAQGRFWDQFDWL